MGETGSTPHGNLSFEFQSQYLNNDKQVTSENKLQDIQASDSNV